MTCHKRRLERHAPANGRRRGVPLDQPSACLHSAPSRTARLPDDTARGPVVRRAHVFPSEGVSRACLDCCPVVPAACAGLPQSAWPRPPSPPLPRLPLKRFQLPLSTSSPPLLPPLPTPLLPLHLCPSASSPPATPSSPCATTAHLP